MAHYPRLQITVFTILLALFLSACGGGGGGGSSPEVIPAYTGQTSQATLTSSNSQALLLGSYAGGDLGGSVAPLSVSSGTALPGRPGVFELSQALKNSIRAVKTGPGGGQSKATSISDSKGRLTSNCGGTADYSIDLDETNGQFSGSYRYNDFCSGGVIISGHVDYSGNYDQSASTFTDYRIRFTTISIYINGITMRMAGEINWVFATGPLAETLTMDVVFVDQYDGKTYWLNNYRVTTDYAAGQARQDLSGRYYDSSEGYVDFSTESPLLINNGGTWPSDGVLVFSGAGTCLAKLFFNTTFLELKVDHDGDGAWDWTKQRDTNASPSQTNRMAVANAGPDQLATALRPVTLDGTGSYDPDGDVLSYWWSFVKCPGSCPPLSSLTEPSPTFYPQQAGTYLLRLTVNDGKGSSLPDDVTVTVNPAIPLNPSMLSLQWKYGIYGTYIGKSGISVLDLEGDGTPEIVAAASTSGFWPNSFWYVVRRISGGDYEQVWSSEAYNSDISRLIALDADRDGTGEIYVALKDGTVLVYNGITFAETASFNIGSNINSMEVADADGDGYAEIILTDGVRIYVYSAMTQSLKWKSTAFGGTNLAVGNIDDDPAPEIIATGGGHGYVLDGATHSLEWDYANDFGTRVKTADIDGDGRDEIVGAAGWYKITIFDAEIKTPTWEITTSIDIGGLLVADVDNDGVKYIVYGDLQGGKIHSIDPTTRLENWSITNRSPMSSEVAYGDVDSDGTNEIIWGAGGPTTGSDHLVLADTVTRTIEWQSTHIDGPLSAVDVGDVDDDGEGEIVMVSFESNSGYNEGIIHIFDARTHALEWRSPLGIRDWVGVRSVRIGDVDGDGQTEFAVTTGDVSGGVIRVYDGKTHLMENQSANYYGQFFTTFEIGDVDGDGKTEIVASQGRQHTGATGSYIIVLDGSTLAEEWVSVSLGTTWAGTTDIELEDIDGDGNIEIIAAFAGSKIYVYDGVTHQLDWLGDVAAQSIGTFDFDGDNKKEILVGKKDGKVEVYRGPDYSLVPNYSLGLNGKIDALRVDDVDQDGLYELIVSSAGKFSIFDITTLDLLWQSSSLGADLGWYNQIICRDIDGDGRKEIITGSQSALYQFE